MYEPLGPKASLVTCKTRRPCLKIRRTVRFLPIGLPTSTLTIAIHGLARYSARVGFVFDSSRRLRRQPSGFFGAFPLAGSGWGGLGSPNSGNRPRSEATGGYWRDLFVSYLSSLIVSLMEWSRARDFRPMVYLHPYDIDSRSLPLDYGRVGHWWPRLGDQLRRSGRSTTAQKLRALARIYDFRPIESMLGPDSNLRQVLTR